MLLYNICCRVWNISKPLTIPLKKDPFHSNSQASTALEQLKKAMTTTLVLTLLDLTKPFLLETGACNTGIGTVLMQNW